MQQKFRYHIVGSGVFLHWPLTSRVLNAIWPKKRDLGKEVPQIAVKSLTTATLYLSFLPILRT
jgi:hypothetical protein